MIDREAEAKSCEGCKFQEEKYCKWWKREDKEELPPCRFTAEQSRGIN